MDPHIVSSFDEKLRGLKGLVGKAGTLAAAQVLSTAEALRSFDAELAAQIIANDQEIDDIDRRVGEQAVLLLALRAPFANDLRVAVTAIKISADFERIADHARSIAKRILAIRDKTCPSVQSLAQMLERVHDLISAAADAYVNEDVDKALAIWSQDKAIDQLYTGAFRELLTYMIEDPRLLETATHLVFAAKDIERMGDHATNIGEMVCYMVTGHPPAGARPKADTSIAAPGDQA